MKQIKVFPCLLVCVAIVFMGGCSALTPLMPEKKKTDQAAVNAMLQNPATPNVITFMVVGKGIAPENAINKGQAQLMAERAAVSDGYRQLAEKIRGVYTEAYQKLGNGIVDYDYIYSQTHSWLRGVDIVDVRQAENEITEAHMNLRVRFTENDMVWWPSGA